MASGSVGPAESSHSGSIPYVALYIDYTSDSTGIKYTWTLWYYAGYAVSTSSSKTVKAQIAGSTVYNSTYSINGKTGWNKISSGTKTLKRTKTKQTYTHYVEIQFGGVNWGGTVLGTRSGSVSDYLNPLSSYIISYNANGGSGAPSSGTKWYGETYTIASGANMTPPSGKRFDSWNTSSSGTGASYVGGSKYTSNAGLSLYATWVNSSSVAPPAKEETITLVRGERSSSDSWVSKPAGNDVYGQFKIKKPFDGEQYVAVDDLTISMRVSITASPTWEVITSEEEPEVFTLTFYGTEFTALQWDTSITFTCRIVWSTAAQVETTTDIALGTLPGNFFLLDFAAGGQGLGVGSRAIDGYFNVSMRSMFDRDVANASEAAVPLDIYKRSLSDTTKLYQILSTLEVADYPIAYGKSGIWTWRKWKSGIAECWGAGSSMTITTSSSWGNMYCYYPVGSISYPTDLFKTNTVPIATMVWVPTDNDGWMGLHRGGSDTSTPSGILLRATNASTTGYIRYYAIGEASGSAVPGEYDLYPGPYEVTSIIGQNQVFTASNMLMERDLTVYAIPEVVELNSAGGNTYTIGQGDQND